MPPQRPFFIPILMVLMAMLSIQFGASLAKQLFPIIGAGTMTGLRLFFAALILLAIWRPWRHKFNLSGQLNIKKNKFILLYGASLGLMNLFFYLALEKIPLGIAVALEFTGPLAVAIWQSRRFVDFLWALLATVGIYLIMPMGTTAESINTMGVVWALLAGGCWASYIVFGQVAGQNENLGAVTSLGMLVAALVVMPYAFMTTSFQHLQIQAQIQILPMALLIAILSSAIPYSLEMIALKQMPTKTFGILMSLEPAIATAMGFLNLKENLTLTQGLALVCIVSASMGSTLTAVKSSKVK